MPLPADPETGLLTYSAWAFYPAFPLLVRGLMVTGVSFEVAAVALNLVLGAVCTLLVWRCCTSRCTPRRSRPASGWRW